MPKVSIRLSRNAAEKARKPNDLKEAALAAFQAAGAGDIYFALFRSNGQQFALSSRTIVEVDWVPNRLPDKIIRQTGKPSLKKR
jgi:hypothetical protein